MEEGIEQRRLDEKRERLGTMMQFVHPGLICEMGCGGGFVLEFLSERLPGSMIIGVDRSLERLETAASKAIPGAHQVASDISQRVFAERRFDSVIFIWSMHEVYSRTGDQGVLDTLKTVRKILKDDGVMVLQDFLRPAARQVTLGFKNDHTRDKFRRFTREFYHHKVEYADIGAGIRLDLGDAAEFISKYRSEDEEDWRHEMAEIHFFYTLEQHVRIARKAGFAVTRADGFPLSWEAVDAAERDMEFDFAEDYPWVQLVLHKDRSE